MLGFGAKRRSRLTATAVTMAAVAVAVAIDAGATLTAWSADRDNRPIAYISRDTAGHRTREVRLSGGLSYGPLVAVLAPEDTGGTSLAQPTLYWFTSTAIDKPVVVTLTETRTNKVLTRTVLQGPFGPGIQAAPVSRLRVALSYGREYRWSVAVQNAGGDRDPETYSSATIRRWELPYALAEHLNRTSPAEMPYFLAANGLWYDALAVLSAQIANDPLDAGARDLRASLLEQCGLYDVVAAGGR